MTPLPDRVRDAIRAELPSARQVQPRTGPMRFFTMLSSASAGARLGLAAAAVVVAVVLGAAFLNNNQRGGVVGVAAPRLRRRRPPRASTYPVCNRRAERRVATAHPDAASVTLCDVAAGGCVKAGTDRLSGRAGRLAAVMFDRRPRGLVRVACRGTGFDAVLVDSGAANRPGLGLGCHVRDGRRRLARDPCDSAKGLIPAAQVDTPQKLAAAMAAWPRFTATTPQPITVDGHSGLKFS